MRTRAGWSLWSDWCRAASVDVCEVTDERLRQFRSEVAVGRRHLADIRAGARELGCLTTEPGQKPDPWTVIEDDFDPLPACLRRCPRTGWTAGYTGRRDAWLLVLTRGLRMTRAEALAVTAEHLQGWKVAGRELPYDDDPIVCHRCTAARWLACRELEHRWHRDDVRQMLIPADSGDEAHECRRRNSLTTGLPAWAPLSPALDRHGWISGGYQLFDPADPDGPVTLRQMSPRAVTAVLARRCLTGERPDDPARPDRGEDKRACFEESGTATFDSTTFERLEDACARADEVNSRITELLDDTDRLLDRSSGTRKRRKRDRGQLR